MKQSKGSSFFSSRRQSDKRLSCRTLSADDSTVKSGKVLKETRSIFACFPTKVTRTLILKGHFLLRYATDKNGESAGAPKGKPIDITLFTFGACDDEKSFELHNINRSYVFECDSEAECKDWLVSIKAAKHIAIKQQMGHMEVPLSDQTTNAAAAKLSQSLEKDEMRAAEAESEVAKFANYGQGFGVGMMA
jgi:hypothetical protein